jgi:hypothetical protein
LSGDVFLKSQLSRCWQIFSLVVVFVVVVVVVFLVVVVTS